MRLINWTSGAQPTSLRTTSQRETKVNEPIHYVFVDESGDTAHLTGSYFLVVALLSTTRNRPIELYVKRAHKKYGTSLASGEMKASTSRERVVEQLLQAIIE